MGRFHGAAAGASAREHFEKRFQEKDAFAPDEATVSTGGDPDIALCQVIREVGFAKSNSEARRLVGQGAVKIEDQAVEDPNQRIPVGREFLLAVGRRRLARVRVEG